MLGEIVLSSNPSRGGHKSNKATAAGVADAIGTIHAALIIGVSRNPSLRDELMKIAFFGHASVLAGGDLEMTPDILSDLLVAFNETKDLWEEDAFSWP